MFEYNSRLINSSLETSSDKSIEAGFANENSFSENINPSRVI